MTRRMYVGEALVTRMDKVPRANVHWLWPQRVPLGKLTLLAGDPGLGKSFITLEMAARTSRGDGWPDGMACAVRRRHDDTPCDDDPPDGTMGPRDVPVGADTVLLSAEDDPADTLRPRLEAMNADLSRVRVLSAVDFPHSGMGPGPLRLDRDIDAIDQALERCPRPRLVVIDPISAYLGDVDGNNNAEVRRLLMGLSDLAARRGVAVVCVTHLNKGGSGGGGKAVYRSMGSLAFTAAARVVWAVMKDPEEPRRRLMLPVKCNITPDTRGLAYRVEDGRLAWERGEVSLSADDVERGEAAPVPTPGELDEAIAWLRERLEGGAVPATEVTADAAQCAIAERTLKRARRELGVVSRREAPPGVAARWVWELPPRARPLTI